MTGFIKMLFALSMFLGICIPVLQAQDGVILAVRGNIGNEILFQFVGTQEDIAAQCVGGFVLMQNSVSFFENDAIPFWTGNEQLFNPPSPVNHEFVCQTVVAGAMANEMASPDAQFHAKGEIDGEFEYELTGNFVELLELATQWLTENQIEFAFMISAEGWDGNTYTFETPLLWSSESLALIMRAFSNFVEPATITHWEIH